MKAGPLPAELGAAPRSRVPGRGALLFGFVLLRARFVAGGSTGSEPLRGDGTERDRMGDSPPGSGPHPPSVRTRRSRRAPGNRRASRGTSLPVWNLASALQLVYKQSDGTLRMPPHHS